MPATSLTDLQLDGHRLLRKGLVRVRGLECELEVTGEISIGYDAIQQTKDHCPGGYGLKNMDPEQILGNLQQAALGKPPVSQNLSHLLAVAIRRKGCDLPDILTKLGRRGHQVFRCIAKGLSKKLITRNLDISDGTVKVQVKYSLINVIFDRGFKPRYGWLT
ncbi:DNA-binding response regulator, NarL/FixJ family, contains REC and HTH domains [Alteromonadaceae bacterium Bs31]|nr:DNA-binding response regulator, NarL/FixJ family, contains REC and HTH domains [Alteromonadaceae bacterium Bs31]